MLRSLKKDLLDQIEFKFRNKKKRRIKINNLQSNHPNQNRLLKIPKVKKVQKIAQKKKFKTQNLNNKPNPK